MTTVRPNPPSVTSLPPEMLRSAPRTVALTFEGAAAITVAVLLALAGIGGGAAFYAVADRDQHRASEWISASAPAPAEVIRLGRTRDDHPRRVVSYRYSAGGREYEGRTVLRERDRRDFPLGSAVAVRFAVSDPAVSWMPDYEPRGAPLWVAPLISLAALLAAVLIALGVRRQRLMLEEGRAALARVTRVKKRAERNRRSYYRVEYEFTLLSGAVRQGRAENARQAPEAGSMVVILYDRERPEKSALYPLSLVRVDVPA
jgi:hypothetical protein